MIEFLLLVIAVLALVIAILVYRIFIDLRVLIIEHIPLILAALKLLSKLPGHGNGYPSHHTYEPENGLSDVIWEWRDAIWHVVAESQAAGIDSGPPPDYPGSFPGERVKTRISRRTT